MSRPSELATFRSLIQGEGLRAALAYLNSRTPHRCTAVYRYDAEVMRNVLLFDRADPAAEHGIDVAVQDAYCGAVATTGKPFAFKDMHLLPKGKQLPRNPIVCYCGVVVRAPEGGAWGTLCHYDFQPCQMRTSDIPLLEAAAPLVYAALGGSANASSGQRGLTSKA